MNEGLDQEMPGGKFMGDTLAAMVADKEVSMAKVRQLRDIIMTHHFHPLISQAFGSGPSSHVPCAASLPITVRCVC